MWTTNSNSSICVKLHRRQQHTHSTEMRSLCNKIWRKQTHFFFHFVLHITHIYFPNECPGLCRQRTGHSLGEKMKSYTMEHLMNCKHLISEEYFIMIWFHIYLHWISVDIEKSANPSLYPLFWMASPIQHFWEEENHPSMHGIGNQNDIHFSNNFFWKNW